MTCPLPGAKKSQDVSWVTINAATLLVLFLGMVAFFPTCTAQAKIYKWVDENGTLHLKDYPASMYEEEQQDAGTQAPGAEETQQAEDGVASSGIAQQVSGIRSDAVQTLLESVERGFRSEDVEQLASQFQYFEQTSEASQVKEHRQRIDTLLSDFFKYFGVTLQFERGSRPGDTTQLGRVVSAYPDKWQNAECEYSYFEFLAPLKEHSGTAVVRFSVCESQGQAWLSDLTLSLGNISPQLAEAARRFVAGEEPAAEGEPAVVADARTAGDQTQQKDTPKRVVPKMRKGPSTQPQVQPLPDLPMEFMPVMGMFTGTIFLVYIAIWLVFYFFMALCLYLIARKLRVGGAWLSWLPIVSIFPMVASGGKPWWWGVLFLLPMLSFIPYLGIAFALLMLVNLVLIALVWMGICRRLGQNKWLGLLIYVPLANIVLMAVLAFKKEPFPTGIAMGRVLMWVGVAFVLLLVGFWAVFTYGVMPFMMDSMTKAFNQGMSQVQQHQPAQEQPVPAQPSGPPTTASPSGLPQGVASLTQAEYEDMLSQAEMSYQGTEPNVSAGPAAFQFAHFWDNEDNPHLWVKVKMAPLPNLGLFKSAKVTVDHVWNQSSRNVYDSNSNFETEFFQELSFNTMDGPPPHLEAIRSVYLLSGTEEGDISEIKGTLSLRLPLGVQAVALTPDDVNKSVTASGFTVTVLSFDDQEVQIQFQGPEKRNLTVLAFDGQGQQVSHTSSSWWTSGENTKTVTYSYDASVVSVKALLADAILEKRYPFTIQAQ